MRNEPQPARGLLVAFFALWVVLAIAPKYRADWAVENVLVAAFFVCLWLARRRVTLSQGAWVLLIAFLSLHEVGAHYTYSEVPYDAWFHALTGKSLNALLGFERNHYDRLVHFSAGLLLLRPMREALCTQFNLTVFTSCLLCVNIVMSGSMLYELIEWGAANVFGAGLGAAYLGSQGDPWDAQKDMALATLGALVAWLGTAFRSRA